MGKTVAPSSATRNNPRRNRSSGERLPAYVELVGPVEPDWLAALRRAGMEPLQYRSPATYLCVGSTKAFHRVSAARFVRRIMPLLPTLKPRVTFSADGSRDVWIVELVETPRGGVCFERLPASLTGADQERFLATPHVLAIEPREPPVLQDEVTGLILAGQYDDQGIPSGSYLEWLSPRPRRRGSDHRHRGQRS